MSAKLQVQGRAGIYDAQGRTKIPNDIMDHLGLEKGDKFILVENDEGQIVMLKEE